MLRETPTFASLTHGPRVPTTLALVVHPKSPQLPVLSQHTGMGLSHGYLSYKVPFQVCDLAWRRWKGGRHVTSRHLEAGPLTMQRESPAKTLWQNIVNVSFAVLFCNCRLKQFNRIPIFCTFIRFTELYPSSISRACARYFLRHQGHPIPIWFIWGGKHVPPYPEHPESNRLLLFSLSPSIYF